LPGFGDDADTLVVVGLDYPIDDVRGDLSSGFGNDILSCVTDCFNSPGGKDEYSRGAEQSSDENLRYGDVDCFEFDWGDHIDFIDKGAEE